MEHNIKEPLSVSLGGAVVSGGGHGESTGRPFASRKGPKLWSVVALSALGSAAAVAAVGCFCALIYPILKGKRARAHTRTCVTQESYFEVRRLALLNIGVTVI